MKHYKGCFRIALNELRNQLRFYFVFLVSAILFFSMLTAVVLTAKRLPDVLNKNMVDTNYNLIEMNRIPDGFLPELEALPAVIHLFPIMSSRMIGIEDTDVEKRAYTENVTDPESGENKKVSFSTIGMTGNYLREKPNPYLKDMNAALVSGTPWDEDDNKDCKIWLSEYAASLTGRNVGDRMLFTGKEGEDLSVVVEGIYKRNDPVMFCFYVTFPVYTLIQDEMVNTEEVMIRPDSIFEHKQVLNEIKSHFYYASSFSGALIDGYMSLLLILYVLCGFIGLLVVGILFTTAQAYYSRRIRFFSIMKALGFRDSGVLVVVCTVIQGILTIAFLFSQLISPYLIGYVSDSLSVVYSDIIISNKVWDRLTFLIFLFVSVLTWVACLLGRKVFRTGHITDLIRKEL